MVTPLLEMKTAIFQWVHFIQMQLFIKVSAGQEARYSATLLTKNSGFSTFSQQ
jgi:hypothetical protein